MVLFWICIPLMAIMAVFAVGIVLVPSIRERRKRHAQRLIEGRSAAPADGAKRLAVDVAPRAAGSAHKVLERHIGRHARLSGARVDRTPDYGGLLVTVPDGGGDRAKEVDRLADDLDGDEAFGEVREIPDSTDSPAPERQSSDSRADSDKVQ